MSETEDEKRCERCRFWSFPHDNEGTCHRRAPIPMPNALWNVSKTVALLLWWYVREHSDEATAEEELKTYLIEVESEQNDPDQALWPTTRADEWCGEFETGVGERDVDSQA